MPNSQVKSLTINGTTYDIVDETSGYITGITVLSYGTSTYADALAAYQANRIVYCRASSNSNPATGNQSRMAFLAYVNDPTTPTEFEFQYYRSVSSHSDSQQGDQVYVYKLNSSGTWSVTTREAYTKIAVSTGLTSSYSNGVLTASLANTYGDTKNPYGAKTANYVLAGPTSGSAAVPGFRALVADDIPDLSSIYLTSYTETDPTVPSWAKASSKPSYSLSEISGTTNLRVIESLSGFGLLKKEDEGVWSLDKSSYLTSNSTLNAAKLDGAIPSGVTATTQSSSDNSTKIATTAYVTAAIAALPEPMLFKGSVGTGGTITSLPAAAAANEGFTYKVITALSTPVVAKVGDTVISNGSSWVVIPSGDEPAGTVTSVGLSNATNGGLSISGSPITSSGTISIGHSNVLASAQTTQAVYPIKIDKNGHISAYGNAITIPTIPTAETIYNALSMSVQVALTEEFARDYSEAELEVIIEDLGVLGFEYPKIPSNIVNTITTTAGTHTAITNQKGNVSFNVPTTASHVGASASDHTHGNITNGGDITATAPEIGSGDRLVINDDSASKITNGPAFDGTTTKTALTPKGTWENFVKKDGSYGDPVYSYSVYGLGASSVEIPVYYSTQNITDSNQVTTKGYVDNAINGKIDTAGTGLSKSGTTLNHTNSITAQTTSAVYPIKIDAQGHITEYGSAVTIPDVSGKIDTAGVGLDKSGTTLKAKLNSETAITDTSKVYNVGVNSSGELCVKVSWSDIQTRTSDSGTSRTIYLAGGTTSSDEIGELSKHDAVRVSVTANNATSGTAWLLLGNSTASTIPGGKEGCIRLYGSSTSFTNLKVAASTSSKTITFPDKTGTVALTDDIPTITLNGSATTSPSFYAPTSAGTSGYVLTSNGSGAPSWSNSTAAQIIRWAEST